MNCPQASAGLRPGVSLGLPAESDDRPRFDDATDTVRLYHGSPPHSRATMQAWLRWERVVGHRGTGASLLNAERLAAYSTGLVENLSYGSSLYAPHYARSFFLLEKRVKRVQREIFVREWIFFEEQCDRSATCRDNGQTSQGLPARPRNGITKRKPCATRWFSARSTSIREPTMQELVNARGAFEAGDWRRAGECYRRVVEVDPHCGEAVYRLGLLALHGNDPPAAAEWLQKAVALGGRDATLFNQLGVARASSSSSRKRSPASIRPWNSRRARATRITTGATPDSLGRLDEAVEKFRAAAAIMPESPEIHYNLANALRDLGRLNDAVASYREALRLKPRLSPRLQQFGQRPQRAGQAGRGGGELSGGPGHQTPIRPRTPQPGRGPAGPEVRRRGHRAVPRGPAGQPGFCGSPHQPGEGPRRAGPAGRGPAAVAIGAEPRRSNAEAQLHLADKLRQAGRFDEAVACIQAVIAARADFAAAHNDLGLVWFGKQDYAQAIESYRQAIRIKPDFAEAHNNLAIALFITGEVPAGLAAVDTALRIKPDFPIAHLNRAVTWLRMGRFETGWHEFEWRRLCESYRIAPLPRLCGRRALAGPLGAAAQ